MYMREKTCDRCGYTENVPDGVLFMICPACGKGLMKVKIRLVRMCG